MGSVKETATEVARQVAGAAVDELAGPWIEVGGPPEERIGRRIGAGIALGAAALGVALAIWAELRR